MMSSAPNPASRAAFAASFAVLSSANASTECPTGLKAPK